MQERELSRTRTESADEGAVRLQDAEEALRESEERYRVLADVIPQHLWMSDADGRVTYFSRRWYEYTGTSPRTAEVEGWVGRLHPDDVARTLECWRRSLRTGQRFSIEHRLRDSKGDHHWFLAQAMPQRDGTGGILRWVGTLTDIDQRRRSADTLRLLSEASRVLASSLDYEETLRTLARLAASTLADWCVIDLVANGGIMRVEVAHRDAARAKLARSLREHPRRPTAAGGVPQVIRTGEARLIREVSDEWLRQAAGEEDELIELARRLGIRSVMIVPLRASGRTLGAITLIAEEASSRYDESDLERAQSLADRAALFMDNAELYRDAERARAQAEQRAREERALRDAVTAVGASVTTGEVFRQLAMSAESATGADGAFVTRIDVERDEIEVVALASGTPSPLLHAIPYSSSYTRAVIEAGRPIALARAAELEGPGRAGDFMREYADWSVLVIPLTSEVRPIGALFLLRKPHEPPFSDDAVARARTFGELTSLAFRRLEILEESERRREELERITESRSRLMRGFSHDLKNPLGAADGYAQLLADGIRGELDPKQAEAVERIRRSLGSALALIADLLELARAESGQIEIERVRTDVAAVVREVADEFRAQAAGARLELHVSAPRSLVVATDPARVRQILANLLSNAVAHASAGTVTVSAASRCDGEAPRRDDWIAIAVADTGPGIPPEHREAIFREFARLSPAARRGAGVGLAISRHIARLLGGDLTLESEVGRGSTFTIWLPEAELGEAATRSRTS